jgi:uncharacterized protein (DUF1330 family)
MPAYVVFDTDVQDPAAYKEYQKFGAPSVPQYGGRFLARGGTAGTLEGPWRPRRVVILEFENAESAMRWYRSPEYENARTLRLHSASAKAVAVDGL